MQGNRRRVRNEGPPRGVRSSTLAYALLATAPWMGCYDASALVEARRASLCEERLEEVDLGDFRISLPRPSSVQEVAEIHFRAFATVDSDDASTTRQLLEQQAPLLQHQLLMAIREMGLEEIQDPQLAALRRTIMDTFNANLPGEPLKWSGFHSFGFSNY